MGDGGASGRAEAVGIAMIWWHPAVLHNDGYVPGRLRRLLCMLFF